MTRRRDPPPRSPALAAPARRGPVATVLLVAVAAAALAAWCAPLGLMASRRGSAGRSAPVCRERDAARTEPGLRIRLRPQSLRDRAAGQGAHHRWTNGHASAWLATSITAEWVIAVLKRWFEQSDGGGRSRRQGPSDPDLRSRG